jgi:SAM-dependent methyltransferase
VGADAREQLRATFDEDAALYDRARPGYPAELFDDLAALARLAAGARIVEVGCGTGQATVPLAELKFGVVCVEFGGRLAAIARRRLAGFPAVDVVEADFETWQPAHAGFDALVAFTSFHWIDPALRYARAASLLRERGTLAVVATKHVLPPGGDDFFVDVQADYEAVLPDDPSTKAGPPPPPELVADAAGEIAASGLFRNLAVRRYIWDVVSTADEYLALLATYSGHRALDADTRADLLARIRRRIESRPGGTVRKTYLATLNVAERR